MLAFTEESIHAHVTVVFAALAITRRLPAADTRDRADATSGRSRRDPRHYLPLSATH